MVEGLASEVKRLGGENERLLKANERQQVRIDNLLKQLEWCKREIFGQKSERFIDVPSKDQLFFELDLADLETESEVDEEATPAAEDGEDKSKAKRGPRRPVRAGRVPVW